MRKRLLLSARTYLLLVSALMGAAIFIGFYGIAVLNPSSVDWIKGGGDFSQHYIGWIFYRNSADLFPLGSISGLAYPHGLAVTYMDAIPLLALPFKLFNEVLPAQFQYFGIWGLMSYILTAIISALIFLKLTKNHVISFMGAILIVLSPIIFDRMFSHTALAGHWIILTGILVALYTKKLTVPRFVITWSAVLILSVLIHPYFLPMNGLILAIAIIRSWKSFRDAVSRVILPVVSAVLVFALIGGFSVGGGYATGGLDKYTINANSLINPLGWSAFVPAQPTHDGSYEGLAYLGIGGILLCSIASIIGFTIVKRRGVKKWFASIVLAVRKPRNIFTILAIVAFVFISFGTVIHIGGWAIALPVPDLIEKAWSVFRASGRLFWPLYYLLLIIMFVFVYRRLSKKVSSGAVIGIFIVIISTQAVDILASQRAATRSQALHNSASINYSSPFDVVAWRDILKGRAHIQLMDKPSDSDFFALAYLAEPYNLTLSDGYFARSPGKAILAQREKSFEELRSGTIRKDTVYLTKDNGLAEAAKSSGAELRQSDGFFILTMPQ